MKHTLTHTIACAFAAFSLVSSTYADDAPDTSTWKNLFAADLSGATNGEHWKWEDGSLVAKDHVTIWTKESYGNFVLDLEFKVAKESNSGLFLRSGNIADVLAALEIQVHDSTDGTKFGMLGAIYDAKAPTKNMAKPIGEWNHYTITCKDSLISVVLNGEKIINVDLNDWSEVKKNPDGTPNKFSKPLKDYSRKGPIGLQGLHGKAMAPVWYRNLKIKPLE
ncbi:MAG: DUF1080 domain-containing protein [Gloeobacteraceae cyanobacterium ES-bin-144]|nr:DUF1080 domain-containing protein [Verrucomicrobiales bacterium]